LKITPASIKRKDGKEKKLKLKYFKIILTSFVTNELGVRKHRNSPAEIQGFSEHILKPLNSVINNGSLNAKKENKNLLNNF